MEPNKPTDTQEEPKDLYTPGQQVFLRLLQWSAYVTAFVAMLYVMHT